MQELAPRVEPEEVGLPVVEAPESSPSPSVAPSTDKNSNTRMQSRDQADGLGENKKS